MHSLPPRGHLFYLPILTPTHAASPPVLQVRRAESPPVAERGGILRASKAPHFNIHSACRGVAPSEPGSTHPLRPHPDLSPAPRLAVAVAATLSLPSSAKQRRRRQISIRRPPSAVSPNSAANLFDFSLCPLCPSVAKQSAIQSVKFLFFVHVFLKQLL